MHSSTNILTKWSSGIIVLTLLLCAATLEWMINALGLAEVTRAEEEVYVGEYYALLCG